MESKELSEISSSKSLTLLSYNEKDNNNLKIIIKENNDNVLYMLNKEKIDGDNYESYANKTFELICNISLNRNIKVQNYNHKNPYKINSFFELHKEKKIDDFKIDSYIARISGKELTKIHQKFPHNFFSLKI